MGIAAADLLLALIYYDHWLISYTDGHDTPDGSEPAFDTPSSGQCPPKHRIYLMHDRLAAQSSDRLHKPFTLKASNRMVYK